MKADKKILLVDDNAIDRRSVIRAFQREKLPFQIFEASDGIEALEFLNNDSNLNDRACNEFLILLDLNMPRMDGHEFLDEMRSHEKLRNMIIFVFTSSDSEVDKWKAYNKCVSGYLLKSGSLEAMSVQIKMLNLFINTVDFPPRAGEVEYLVNVEES